MTFEGTSNFPIEQICLLLSLLVLIHSSTGYSMQTKYVLFIIMKYLCLLGGKYKFTANVKDNNHKITKTHHFVA